MQHRCTFGATSIGNVFYVVLALDLNQNYAIWGLDLNRFLFIFGLDLKINRNSQAEVDFLIRYKSHVLPIEVKTGNNSKLRSLHLFMNESKEKLALRLWNGSFSSDNISKSDGNTFTLYNIPIYYAGSLDKLLGSIL